MKNDIEITDNNNPVISSSKGVASLYDWVHTVIFAIAFISLLLTFGFRMVDVKGGSMNNTLLNQDKLFVSDLFYTPSSGDVVIISHGEQYDEPLVKRVIATEGQTLRIDFENERIYVDGTLLDEPYVSSELKEGNTEIPEVIPEGKIFVMGDNRLDSLDSRYSEIGLIDEDNIIESIIEASNETDIYSEYGIEFIEVK